jgi:hypothetical protein
MDTAINPEPRAFYQFQATRALAEDVKPVNTLNPIGLKLFNTIN